MTNLDEPWKEAIELWLCAFLQFFFRSAYELIDWTRPPEALDKELQQIAVEAASGRRIVDKLFKVWLLNGDEAWILIHIEIQSQRDETFALRMFVYHYRIFDKFQKPVISLAVLGDENANWRPSEFGYNRGGCSLQFKFPVAKLLDIGADVEALETDVNPFAALVLAHLKTLETRRDPKRRHGWKFRVIKSLYSRGYKAEQVRRLFRLIDWMMSLPKELDIEFRQRLLEFEAEKQMPYITSVERLGFERGIAEGVTLGKAEGKAEAKADMVCQVLERRLGAKAPLDLEAAIRNSRDLAQLDRWVELAWAASSVEEFRRLMQ